MRVYVYVDGALAAQDDFNLTTVGATRTVSAAGGSVVSECTTYYDQYADRFVDYRLTAIPAAGYKFTRAVGVYTTTSYSEEFPDSTPDNYDRTFSSTSSECFDSFAAEMFSSMYWNTYTFAVSVYFESETQYGALAYDANGGQGAPAAQTFVIGAPVTLSNTKPTRNGYQFLGWATSAQGQAVYARGGTYTFNASLRIYAAWRQYTHLLVRDPATGKLLRSASGALIRDD